MTARFHIAVHAARYATVATLCTVSKAVAIIHNIVTELRRESYLSREHRELAAISRGAHVGGPCGAGAWGGPRGGGVDDGGVENLAPSQGPVPVILPIAQAAPNSFVRAMRGWREVRNLRETRSCETNWRRTSSVSVRTDSARICDPLHVFPLFLIKRFFSPFSRCLFPLDTIAFSMSVHIPLWYR